MKSWNERALLDHSLPDAAPAAVRERLMAKGRRLGTCLVCGEPVLSHAEGLEFYLGIRVVVCAGACEHEFDEHLKAAVVKIARKYLARRQARVAAAGKASESASNP